MLPVFLGLISPIGDAFSPTLPIGVKDPKGKSFAEYVLLFCNRVTDRLAAV
jgi:hypothetical protein